MLDTMTISIPHGTIKRTPRQAACLDRKSISIPHGTIKRLSLGGLPGVRIISIPHGTIKSYLYRYSFPNNGDISIPHGTIKSKGVFSGENVAWNFNSTWYD